MGGRAEADRLTAADLQTLAGRGADDDHREVALGYDGTDAILVYGTGSSHISLLVQKLSPMGAFDGDPAPLGELQGFYEDIIVAPNGHGFTICASLEPPKKHTQCFAWRNGAVTSSTFAATADLARTIVGDVLDTSDGHALFLQRLGDDAMPLGAPVPVAAGGPLAMIGVTTSGLAINVRGNEIQRIDDHLQPSGAAVELPGAKTAFVMAGSGEHVAVIHDTPGSATGELGLSVVSAGGAVKTTTFAPFVGDNATLSTSRASFPLAGAVDSFALVHGDQGYQNIYYYPISTDAVIGDPVTLFPGSNCGVNTPCAIVAVSDGFLVAHGGGYGDIFQVAHLGCP